MGGAVMLDSSTAARAAHYTGKTTLSVVLIAIVAASGGLLFGFDNGITGGVISNPDFQAKFFPSTLAGDGGSSNAFCKYDNHMLSLFTSSLFLAGAAAALVGGWTCNRFGRKMTMMAGGAAFGIGTALVAASQNIAMLVIGRVVLGVGVGFATQATPLYLSEMAPHNIRGALNIMFQLAVTIGIFAAQLINYGTLNIPVYGWRISLALGGVPALLLFFGAMILPDTPNSLLARGRTEQGKAVLQRIRGTEDVDAEYEDIVTAVATARTLPNPYLTILGRRYWPQLIMSMLIPMFQQFTGINAIMFYAPQMFEAAGQASSDALFSTVIVGAVNVGSTLVAIAMVDMFGRRILFLQGGMQMMTCLVIVGALINVNFKSPGNTQMAASIVAFICIYVAGFAWSWGPLAWLVPSEIHSMETRAAGMGIATCTNFLFTFLIGQTFLTMLCTMTWGVFIMFAGFVIIMSLFIFFCVPETKGVPVEEMVELIIRKHWLWSRVAGGAPSAELTEQSSSSSGIAKVEGAPSSSVVGTVTLSNSVAVKSQV